VGFFVGGISKQNLEEEEPPFQFSIKTLLSKHPKLINFGGCSSGGWLFIRVLGLETTQQIHSPGFGGFLQSNTHCQFSIKTLFMIWWLSKERSVFNKNSTLTEKSKMIKDRFVTKTDTKKQKKITKKSPSAPSRKKKKKEWNWDTHYQFSIKNSTLKEISLVLFFKSQHDTFQCLTAPHSLVMGARSGEAQRADAAARHQGRSKPWAKTNSGPIPGIYRNFLNTGGLSFFFPIPGVYRSCH